MSKLSFGNIILAQNGKKGILKPDENGYYLINAGGFNIPNRAGITYTGNQYIKECMHPDSDLARRLKRGEVYAEAGHPPMFFFERVGGVVVRTPITDLLQWINRLKTIDMDRACAHISEIIFDCDDDAIRRGLPIYNLIRVKPFESTVYGRMFKENLDTPEMNTSMSIRTVTTPMQFGDTTRNVEYFTNYDWVFEPGLSHANKHSTAGCESFSQELKFDENAKLTLTEDQAIQIIEHGLSTIDSNASLAGVEALENIDSVLQMLKKNSSDRRAKHVISFQTGSMGLF